ncbi:hypothetical protein [Fimbriimonas ginsengisoli]|uniref:Nucleotidyltransferase domain-containing protein n=1 Tax=Fimbriimonas ginsengisoli Gsoil 348 TaxID=661478 RepID=A0A068NMG0_FIMGI|nr:hypothetical protein [Fimbriimonas ginsengisoli]AIE84763.1 hypothetical protein OP10G_1395 [Fimbriimonas ginsengisoli Gsoil 348]
MRFKESELAGARDRLLPAIRSHLIRQQGVVGLFLAGSIPAGTADAYSDIDLKVVVRPGRYLDFVTRRLELPRNWPGFLFNEWVENAAHCVSHFRPFLKVDVYYLNEEALAPTPWLSLPTEILYDPEGIVWEVVERSQRLRFEPDPNEIDRSIGKGLAAAHEAYRRIQRGELAYAQSLLDELRLNMAMADDWLGGRPAQSIALSRIEQRGSELLLAVLRASYVPLDVEEMKGALARLVGAYRAQVAELHGRFAPGRPLENDLEALDIVL